MRPERQFGAAGTARQPGPVALFDTDDEYYSAICAFYLIGDLIEYMRGYTSVSRSTLAQAKK